MKEQYPKRLVSKAAALTIGASSAMLLVTPFASAALRTPQALACGAERNRVQVEFRIPAAKGIWQYFPAMGRAPELEEDDRPADVVVFDGQV